MPKLSFLALAAGVFMLSSCGNQKSNEETVNSDSTQTALDPALEKILPHFADAQFPYNSDTTLMLHFTQKDSLVGAEVKVLATEWSKHTLSNSLEYELRDFYKIDSVTALGKYSQWADSLDIGMTKTARAYPLSKLKLNDKTWILTWMLTSASYEACPYFSYTHVCATLVYEGKVSQSFVLGSVESAGDPPAAMSRTMTSVLTADGKIAYKAFEEDQEEETYSTQFNTEYWFEIKDGKFVLVKESKGKEKRVEQEAETNDANAGTEDVKAE